MNFKSTLWALAFACVAVSCSDDVDDGLNNGSEEQGEGVYVTVNVTSAFNPVTKANDEGKGEDGNGDLEDSDKESAVNDVNIFLIPCGDGYSAKMTSNDLTIVNGEESTAIASGFTKDLQPATGAIEHHDAVATVKLSVPELDAWYHVVTVANAGKDLGFETLGALRDYLQTKVWSGENKYGEANSFIMTTHQMWQAGVGGSDLFVTAENSDPNHPAETTAYVERLAARIDMQLKADLVQEEGASLTGNSNTTDKVKITGYQVINQLVGGTYLLKRVTANTAAVDGNINGITNSHPYPYLSDEVWVSGVNPCFNYVLDPWTKKKTFTASDDNASFPTSISNGDSYYVLENSNYVEKAVNTVPINLNGEGGLYKNHFHEGMNTAEFMNFNKVVDDEENNLVSTTESEFTPILYTQENTMTANQQKNGFSTGVIFEAEYAPGKVSQYDETNGNVETPSYDDLDSKAFVVADFARTGTSSTEGGSTITPSRVLSADLRTIAALGLKEGSNENIVKAMFNESGDWTSITSKDDVQKVVSDMSGGPLVVAFKKYLQGKLDGIKDEDGSRFDDVKISLTWNKFVEASHTSDDIAYVPSMDELANGVTTGTKKTGIEVREELAKNYNIAYYAGGKFGGKSYYKYWIKHDPLADNGKMGVMEFAIVRNNVYQLQVNGIKDLGDPLPFTPGKDDPNNPDKETEIYILINLYVKNWVVRSNSGIIL